MMFSWCFDARIWMEIAYECVGLGGALRCGVGF